MKQKEYEGTCYIGVTGPDKIPVLSVISIMNLIRRDGDAVPRFIMGTKGYEVRQKHINAFMESEHDFILLLDHDMIFPADTLERLRSHKRPYVSGLYMRRRFNPMASVWFEPYDGTWPHMPFTDDPERGKLHPIGASGWGCILLHREVIEKTREQLNGEWDIAEDDMDIHPVTGETLTGQKEIVVGSDVRYPHYALMAGYQLYGDPDVRCGHIIEYAITPEDFTAVPENVRAEWAKAIRAEIEAKRGES